MPDPNEQSKPPMVRFDFPPGMSAKDIAEALREACKRIMAEKAGQAAPPVNPGDSADKR
jgi:hypothetical protein